MSAQLDLLIIGGGVIGVCAAHYLAEQGAKVTLVDQGDIAAGCSYGNAGFVVPSHCIPLARPGVLAEGLIWMLDPGSPFYIKARFDLDLFAWLWRFSVASREGPMRKAIPVLRDLSLASIALYDELAGTDGLDFCYQRQGLLLVFNSRRGYAEGVEEAHLLEAYGVPAQTLDSAALQEFEPSLRPEVVGGVYFPGDAHLDPAQFVRGLARLAEQKGVCLRTATEVLGFETSGRRIVAVKTTRGDFEPDQVVLATGAWSPGLARDLRLKLPIQAAKGYSITVKRPAQCPAHPLLLSEAWVAVTPLGPVLRLAGTLEMAGLDFSINRRRVAAIWKAVRDYLRGAEAERLELVEIWRGLRPCTPDGLPIIGRPESYENLIVAAGHAMIGQSLGPITGKLVAQIVCGEKPAIDLTPLKAERFL